MAKFKVGDKVRLKKGLEVGRNYGGIPLFQGMKESMEADGGVYEVKEIKKIETTTICRLDTEHPYYYTEEMLELAEEKEEELDKTKKDCLEALVLMSRLEITMKRLVELMKSIEEE